MSTISVLVDVSLALTREQLSSTREQLRLTREQLSSIGVNSVDDKLDGLGNCK